MTKSKFGALVLSFLIALGLWTYVRTYVNTDYEQTFYNIPVALEGGSILAERQLMLLGAQRVLVIDPAPSLRRVPDALDLASGALRMAAQHTHEPETAILRVPMPDTAGALSLTELEACARAGEDAAAANLDAALDQMGMARCRILAFRRSCR